MSAVETVRVRFPEGHPDHGTDKAMIINQIDFDPLVHVPFDAEETISNGGIADVNANQARELVDLAETKEDLDVLEEQENSREKPRESVIKAISRKREAIAETEKP